MSTVCVEEVFANNGNSRAYICDGTVLAVARHCESGWSFVANGAAEFTEDSDDLQSLVINLLPGGCAYFVRRRIRPRQHAHGRMRHALQA